MPRYYAADLDIRLKVCSLIGSTTETPAFNVGQESQNLLAETAKSLATATTLVEQPLPCHDSGMILQFLGHRANLPFRLILAGRTAKPTEPSSIISKHSSNMPPPPTPTRKALITSVSIPLASIRRLLPVQFTEKPSLKIEAFHNGVLAAVNVVAFKHLNNASDTTFILSGRRVSSLHEKAWALVIPSRVLPSSGAHTSQESAKRWNGISASLSAEATTRGRDDQGFRPPSGDFLHSLARMDMPDLVAKCYVPGAPVWATLDIIVTLGYSRRTSPNNPFVTAPHTFPDFDVFSEDLRARGATAMDHDEEHGAVPELSLVDNDMSRETFGNSSTTRWVGAQNSQYSTTVDSVALSNALGDPTSDQSPEHGSLIIKKLSFSLGEKEFLIHALKTPRFLSVSQGKPNVSPALLATRERNTTSQTTTLNTRAGSAKPQMYPSDSSPLSSADSSISTPRSLSYDARKLQQTPTKSPSTSKSSSRRNPGKCNTGFAGKQASLKPSSGTFPDAIETAEIGMDTSVPKKRRKLDRTRSSAGLDAISNQSTHAGPVDTIKRTSRNLAALSSQNKCDDTNEKHRNGNAAVNASTAANGFETPATPAKKKHYPNESAEGISNTLKKIRRKTTGPSMTSDQRNRLAFDIPELSCDSVLTYVADDEGDTMGIRQVSREKHGWFHEEEFILGVRYILPPGAGMDDP